MPKSKQLFIGAAFVLLIIVAVSAAALKTKGSTEKAALPVTLQSAVALQAAPMASTSSTTGTASSTMAASPATPLMAKTTNTATVTRGTRGFATVDGINFEIVTTSADQQQGLGGRSVIPDNYAMLFVFPKDDTYGFWMKDMLTPIDMIWLNDSGKIVLIDSSVLPSSYPNVFYPPQPIKYVLETRAGFAKERGWVVGTMVPLPAPYGS